MTATMAKSEMAEDGKCISNSDGNSDKSDKTRY